MTTRLFRGRYFWRTYEGEEIKHLSKFFPHDGTVLELGGCLGVVSCLANSMLSNPQNQVVVEANPRLISYLTINRDRNGCKFSIENRIVSRKKKEIFYFHDLIVGGNQLNKSAKKVVLPTTSIESLEKKYHLKFNVLILDIEGGELQFLKQFNKQLKEFKVLYVEFHPFANLLTKSEVSECWRILKGIGFKRAFRDVDFEIWKHR